MDQRIEISDIAKSLVVLDRELGQVIDVMCEMNHAHIIRMTNMHSVHMSELRGLHETATRLSDAIHRIEQALVRGVV
jgi:hypothetical protein